MRTAAFARWWPLLPLSALTLLAHFPAFQLGFVRWDDPDYLTRNVMVQKGLTAESMTWAWTTFFAANYHPITWLSLMLDVELFGMNPCGFHATNVLLHLGNVLLVFLVFQRLTGNRLIAVIVAGVLAIHPQHVESVVWISERKDVLSVFFGLWAMLFYVTGKGDRSRKRMLLVSLFFGLSLLSKPTLNSTTPLRSIHRTQTLTFNSARCITFSTARKKPEPAMRQPCDSHRIMFRRESIWCV